MTQAGAAASSMYAVELLAEFVRRGVHDVVVCPGSRSQALALAAAAAEQVGAIRLHVRIDERSAGFFALGVARETGRPAPVIVTSGSAVANLLPAAVEAHESRLPMILITADRPPELHGVRANQTTEQAGMLGHVVRRTFDIPKPEYGASGDINREGLRDPSALASTALQAALGSESSCGPRSAGPRSGGPRSAAGPVQVNIAFGEPLSGTAGFDAMIRGGFAAAGAEGDQVRRERTAAAPRPLSSESPSPSVYVHEGDALAVVLAGADAGAEAEAFARAAGIPLLAEVVSGARFGREAITAYATLIEDPDIGELTEQVIVFGHPTLTRQAIRLVHRDDVDVVVVDPAATPSTPPFDPARRARIVDAARVADTHDPAALKRWLGVWVRADRALRAERTTRHEPDLDGALAQGYKERSAYARTEVEAMREPVSRAMLAETVWRATWPHDRLVLAASRMVRVLDALAEPRRLQVHANRGVAGIDGTIATALGIACTSQRAPDPKASAGTTRVLIGDLALLHDAGSLTLAPGEIRPRIQIFVANDGGGTIFDDLEVAADRAGDGADDRAAAFDRVMYTPHTLDLSSLAAAHGWGYRRVTTRAEIERLVTEPVAGPEIVEVPPARCAPLSARTPR